MQTQASQPALRARDPREDWIAAAVWISTFLLFRGAFGWIADQARSFQQVGHALLTLGLAAALALREHPDRPRPEWSFNQPARLALLAAYLLAAGALLVRLPVLMLAAASLVVAAALLFVWSPAVSRPAFAIAAALAVLLALALLRPGFDWPLRTLAGSHAAWLLQLIGIQVELAVAVGREPQLLLTVSGRPFVVAPECNGFGILSGTVLVAVLLVLLRPVRWFDKLLGIAVALFVGFAANILRILAIVLLAPVVGQHYMLMHEIVGNAAVLASLAVTWWIVKGLPVGSRA